jgi:hypothetical protein
MKWLLVTTNPAPHVPGTDHPHGAGWNVGDVFARIGTEQVIREVDPQAEFDLLNMDSHESITTEREFDRIPSGRTSSTDGRGETRGRSRRSAWATATRSRGTTRTFARGSRT